MLRCRQVSAVISEFICGELAEKTRAAVEYHLAQCDDCRAEVSAMRRAMEALEKPKQVFEAPNVLESVKRRVAEPVRQRKTAMIGAWSFAGATAVAFVGWLAMTHRPEMPAGPVISQDVVVQAPKQVKPPLPATREQSDRQDVSPTPIATGADRPGHRELELRAPVKRIPRPVHKAVAEVHSEPTVEYVVVYVPEMSEVATAPETVAIEAEQSTTDTSSYTITVTDPEKNEKRVLSVQKVVGPDSEPSVTLDYGVVNASEETDDPEAEERSSIDETPPVCDGNHHSALI